LEEDICLHLPVKEKKDPVVSTHIHAFNFQYMSSPDLPQWALDQSRCNYQPRFSIKCSTFLSGAFMWVFV